MIPFGKAKVVREGTDLTIITYGALVQRSLVAAKQASNEEISVEVIDLRSLNPYDWRAIERSVRKKFICRESGHSMRATARATETPATVFVKRRNA